jgi:cytosine/adenosine deaminase-related metal-dependent hydrolase
MAMADEALKLAHQHMQQALNLIDESKCDLEVGAHLDLAICRLREVLTSKEMSSKYDNAVSLHGNSEANVSNSPK